jgi:hypothetical protein
MFGLVSLGGFLTRFPLIFASGVPSSSNSYIDPHFKRVLWYLIGSTKGGVNRAKIIDLINSHPELQLGLQGSHPPFAHPV